jgi:putative DNA primase/helicase
MNVEEAINKACSEVGIYPPKTRSYGKWLKADTLSGKNGKGDGRLLIEESAVVAKNWQTGISVKVSLLDGVSSEQRQEFRKKAAERDRRREANAEKAARIAAEIVKASSLNVHPYLIRKGFSEEKALTISAPDFRSLLDEMRTPEDRKDKPADYLIAGETAIVMPARLGGSIRTVQLIWEDGTKKFLFDGAVSGTSLRVASGHNTWNCEGYATGLSLRAAFKLSRYSATVLCCFSAANVGQVASSQKGRSFIAADNDKPIPQYDGKGAGEYFAARSGKPFVMPPLIGDDINDVHVRDGIFAVQRLLTDFIRGVGR